MWQKYVAITNKLIKKYVIFKRKVLNIKSALKYLLKS